MTAPTTACALESEPTLGSTVLTVVMRAAGVVPTSVTPHALGTPERQVCARIGDVVLYLTDAGAAHRIRQQWDASQYLAKRLPVHVSQTWLAPGFSVYPIGVAVRPVANATVTARWIRGRSETRTPPHLRMQLDRLVWQVCDRAAWTIIGDALWDAQRYLQ